jgi:hypothetical protein
LTGHAGLQTKPKKVSCRHGKVVTMSETTVLALAEQAIRSRTRGCCRWSRRRGCCEWDEKAAERVRSDANLLGLTPEYLRARAIDFVVAGGEVKQVVEKRPEYSHRDYYYKVIIPEDRFKFGIFVEMELTDQDPELPRVTIFNAHPQQR